MERRKEEKVSEIILRYLRQSHLETPLNEYRLMQAWYEVCDSRTAKCTTDLKIYNQKLLIKLSSSTLRTEILMKRSELIQKLNSKVGANVITDIGFM